MNKDTDRTPQPPAAPLGRPVTEDPSADTGTPSPYFSDESRTRSPRTAPSAPPAATPVPLAEKDAERTDAGRTDTGHTGTGLTAPGTPPRHTDPRGTDTDTRAFGTPAARREPDRDGRTHAAHDGAETLLPSGDQDKLAHRLHQAVTDFVESPYRAVEEAESTFDAVVAGLTDALKARRDTLHVDDRDGGDPGARTEELRITLQHYRDLTERLLKV